VVLSIGSPVRGSTSLLQFRGRGYKLALTGAGGLRKFKEWLQAASHKGNSWDDGLTDRLTSEVIRALCLLPVTELLPQVCLGMSADRDFEL
jgi:hypothetical protein